MKIVAGDIHSNKKTVSVKHQDESLDFVTVNLTIPNSQHGPFDAVVGALNAYWANMPLEMQNQLFQYYKDAHEIMEFVSDAKIMHEQLRATACAICNMHDFSAVHAFLMRTRPVHIPHDLKQQYDSSSPDNSRTYLLDDYLKLVTFTVIIKSMIPIWGEYIQIITPNVGSEFKEARAADLIKTAKIMQSDPALRLVVYMEAYADADELSLAAILGNMSSVDFPDYLRTLTIVRRLATCRLPGNIACRDEPATHLIRDMYGFLKSKVSNSDSLFMKSTVRDKSPESSDKSGSEEDNTSKVELIKLREDIDKGTISRYRIDAMDMEWMYHRLDHTAPLELLEACRINMGNRLEFAGDKWRMAIAKRVTCGWIIMNSRPEIMADLLESKLAQPYGDKIKSRLFGSIVPDYLELPERLNLMIVAQALLFHWGFPDLAAILSSPATLRPINSFMGVQMAAFDPALVEVCFEVYPFPSLPPAERLAYKNLEAEAANSQKAAGQFYRVRVANNPLLNTANALIADLAKYTWTIQVPSQMQSRVNFRRQENRWVIPADLKNQVIKLVLMLKRG